MSRDWTFAAQSYDQQQPEEEREGHSVNTVGDYSCSNRTIVHCISRARKGAHR